MDVILIYLFIFGLFLGSFYNVVALRLCKNESIIFPGSHCLKCNHSLAWYELIPVFSYIGLKGKCRACKSHISIQYPLIELLTGILFAFSYYLFGFSLETIVSIILSSIVIIILITDLKHFVILDEVLIIGTILMAIIYGFMGFEILINKLIGGMVIFGIMLLVKLVGDFAFKQESLGWGDVKLSFVAGFILGIPLGIVYIFLGSILAFPYALYTSFKNKEGILPFGPFLAIALILLFWNFNFFEEMLRILLGGK